MMNKTATYTNTAVALHWIIFALIAANVAVAFVMLSLPYGATKMQLFTYHKWLGVTILLFVIGRLSWRVTHRPPSLVSMPRWQNIAARAMHLLLYALLVIVPVSGYFFSSAMGYRITYLDVIPLPTIINKNMDWAGYLRYAHIVFALTLIVAVVLHALTAFKHHFIDGDETLQRMAPFLSSRVAGRGGFASSAGDSHDGQ